MFLGVAPAQSGTALGGVAAWAEDEAGPDPLAVRIERLTPAFVPERGRLVVAGTVTNESDEDWTDLSVYLLTSFAPFTTAAELATAAASDPRTEFGERLVEPGLYVEIGDLASGESTGFRLVVPRDQLRVSGAPGVYRLGVQVLGAVDGKRFDGADGRTRTFLPLVPRGTPATPLALALQLRQRTIRAPDGTLENVEQWEADLSAKGRLRRLLGLSSTSDSWPLTWLTDPAVVEAAASVSRGNPPLTLSANPPDEATTRAAKAARRWLEAFSAESAGQRVLALPYADVDVSAAYSADAGELVTDAFESGAEILDEFSVTSAPVVASPTGVLSPEALAGIDDGVPALLAPRAAEGQSTPVVDRRGGGEVLLVPTAAQAYGPVRDENRSALAIRQRLLADAALSSLTGRQEDPLVRVLPALWDPGANWQRSRFFAGLDVPWVAATSFSTLLAVTSSETLGRQDVRYPEYAAGSELVPEAFRAAEQLTEEGRQLGELLTTPNGVADRVRRQALTTTSVWLRPQAWASVSRARQAVGIVTGWLDEVTVRGPSFVTMSSETGTFHVTLVNGLDQPVTVGLRAFVAGSLEVRGTEPVELAPKSNGTMPLQATATDIGVHQVTLQPVTAEGSPVGQSTIMSIRSSRIGFILWIAMAAAGGVLFVVVIVRIWLRIRARRRTHGPLLQRADR